MWNGVGSEVKIGGVEKEKSVGVILDGCVYVIV